MDMKANKLDYIASNAEMITAIVPYEDVSIYKSKIKRKFERIVKRFIDILGGIFGSLALIPLTLIIFLANFVSGDRGPIFYSQERIGKNGKKFKMYKYRSMVIGADEKLKRYLEENEEARKEYTKYIKRIFTKKYRNSTSRYKIIYRNNKRKYIIRITKCNR